MSEPAYFQLDAIAASLGLPPPGRSFTLRHQGHALTVELDISSGTVLGLTVTAAAPPLPKVTLTRETGFDRLGKLLGINREIQMGDAAFDAQVYVDDDETVEAAARRLLAPPAIRWAAQVLLVHTEAVRFGPEGVTVELREREDRSAFDPRAFHALLPPLAAMLEALPRFSVPGEAAPPPTPLPGVVSIEELQRLRPAPRFSLAARLALGAYILLLITGWMTATLGYSEWWPPVERGWSITLGVLAGLLVWLLSLPFAALAVRGRASSLQALIGVEVLLAPALVPAGAGALWIYNAEADVSPRTAHSARILAIEPARNDDDVVVGAMVDVASWKDGDVRYSFSFSGWPPAPEIAVGKTLTVFSRGGALGCAYLYGTTPVSSR